MSVLPFGGLELWAAAGLLMTLTFWASMTKLRARICSAGGIGCALPAMSWPLTSALAVLLVAAASLLIGVFQSNEPTLR